jgi:hypothetical protein
VLRLVRLPAPPPPSASPRRDFWPWAIPAAVAFAYACGHLAWYRETPLGQVPVLDEQENLDFAAAIARGTLPPEPFYRAPGYALLLAGLRGLGVPAAALFHAALALGACFHAVNAGLAARVARAWFDDLRTPLLAGLLFALHPVFVHYSTQALDAVPALTFFLLGLAGIAPSLVGRSASPLSAGPWAGASLAWAIAAMLRPNYLLLWGTLPLLAAWTLRRSMWLRGGLAASVGVVVFGSVAAWQWRVSGAPAVLPWQGPYNLWAANQPGTHGRYYVQKHTLPAEVARQNPARAESFYLYQQETGHPPADIRALNAHWRQRFLDHVTQHPLAWLGLLARKGYALLNDWEQYNNKTFAFHQARSPWLRWNPLGWGALLVLAVAGYARLAEAAPAARVPLAALGLAAAASVILFFVSARFRLPLAALAAIGAGGALAAPACWRPWPRRRQLLLALALAATAGVAYSNFDDVRSRATFVQDHALLARAADTSGDDRLAWTEANAALALQPGHRDALRLAVASYFNHLISTGPIPGAEPRWREACLRLLGLGDDSRDLRSVAALALWRAGERDAALAAWRESATAPSAVAARLLVHDLRPDQIAASDWPASAWYEPLVRLAALRFSLPPPPGAALGDPARAAEIATRIFTPTPARAATLP